MRERIPVLPARSGPTRRAPAATLAALACLAGGPTTTTLSAPVEEPAAATQLRRIVVLETNNYRLERGFAGLVLPETPTLAALSDLRAYVRPRMTPASRTELGLLLGMTAFVESRLEHAAFADLAPDMSALAMLQAAEQGQRFTCVEHSKVLVELLASQGVPARSVGLQRSDVAYGRLGSAHVLVEAWSNTLEKWVMLDPQWGVYAIRDGIPLSVLEIFLADAQNALDDVRFEPADPSSAPEAAASLDRRYRDFLPGYMGYLTVSLLTDAERVPVLLRLHGREWPLTFQGLPRRAHLFARQPEDLYFGINRVSLTLEFRPESQPGANRPISFSSEQEYVANMAQFAAVPDFLVTPHHNMPWFDHYEYSIDDSDWTILEEDSVSWTLAEGENRLRVRALNQAGRRGPITQMQIRYAP